MEAPLSSPEDLKSFDKAPAPEDEAAVMAQLVEEVEVRAQRIFTEQLAQQPGGAFSPGRARALSFHPGRSDDLPGCAHTGIEDDCGPGRRPELATCRGG